MSHKCVEKRNIVLQTGIYILSKFYPARQGPSVRIKTQKYIRAVSVTQQKFVGLRQTESIDHFQR